MIFYSYNNYQIFSLVTDELELITKETNEQKQTTRRKKGLQCETGRLMNFLIFVGFIVGLIIGMVIKPSYFRS